VKYGGLFREKLVKLGLEMKYFTKEEAEEHCNIHSWADEKVIAWAACVLRVGIILLGDPHRELSDVAFQGKAQLVFPMGAKKGTSLFPPVLMVFPPLLLFLTSVFHLNNTRSIRKRSSCKVGSVARNRIWRGV
jgi:hypothetical protein